MFHLQAWTRHDFELMSARNRESSVSDRGWNRGNKETISYISRIKNIKMIRTTDIPDKLIAEMLVSNSTRPMHAHFVRVGKKTFV